jgi:hypothetical protein
MPRIFAPPAGSPADLVRNGRQLAALPGEPSVRPDEPEVQHGVRGRDSSWRERSLPELRPM